MALRILLTIIIAFSSNTSALIAQDLTERANEIYKEVLSPYCPGRLLYDCPSSKANELKITIKGMLTEGKSKEEVFNYLYSTFGNDIKAMPDNFGFGLVGWLMPMVFFAIAGLVLIIWVKTQKKNITSNHE